MAIVLAPEHVTACIVAINMFPEARRRAEHFQKRVVRRASKGGPCWLCSFTKILGEDTIKVGYDLLAVKEFCSRRSDTPQHASQLRKSAPVISTSSSSSCEAASACASPGDSLERS